MAKVSVEFEIKDVQHVAAILAIIHLFELDEMQPTDETTWVFDNGDEDYWGQHLPHAICELMGAIEYTLTAWNFSDEAIIEMFHFSDEWERAVSRTEVTSAAFVEWHDLYQQWRKDKSGVGVPERDEVVRESS